MDATYFPDQFKLDLQTIAAKHPPKSNCLHCQIPRDRRVELDKPSINTLSAQFRCCWYLTTLIEQALYRYFPDRLSGWQNLMGVLPLPVEPSGFGCVTAVRPGDLLHGLDAEQAWVRFLPQAVEFLHHSLAGLDLDVNVFLDRVGKDQDFDQRPGSPEAELIRVAINSEVLFR